MTEEQLAALEAIDKAKAQEFVEIDLERATSDAYDGGIAIYRAVVSEAFYFAAYHDAGAETNIAEEFLDLAHAAIDRCSPPVVRPSVDEALAGVARAFRDWKNKQTPGKDGD